MAAAWRVLHRWIPMWANGWSRSSCARTEAAALERCGCCRIWRPRRTCEDFECCCGSVVLRRMHERLQSLRAKRRIYWRRRPTAQPGLRIDYAAALRFRLSGEKVHVERQQRLRRRKFHDVFTGMGLSAQRRAHRTWNDTVDAQIRNILPLVGENREQRR